MSIGFWQLVLIVLIVLLVFGAGKLPRVMGDLGKGIRAMREGLRDDGGDTEGGAVAAANSISNEGKTSDGKIANKSTASEQDQ